MAKFNLAVILGLLSLSCALLGATARAFGDTGATPATSATTMSDPSTPAGETQCRPGGWSCWYDDECCSGLCDFGQCAGGNCLPEGYYCRSTSDCCMPLFCGADNRCG